MPVKRHYFEPGGVYHITFKTRWGQSFLASGAAKEIILQTIGAYGTRLGYHIIGYAIMDTHVHAVIRLGANTTAGKVVRAWKGFSARKFQSLLNRQGSIWQDRYADNHVKSEGELQRVLEYIHNNPVKTGKVRRQTDYAWSSAQAYAGRPSNVLPVNTDWGAG